MVCGNRMRAKKPLSYTDNDVNKHRRFMMHICRPLNVVLIQEKFKERAENTEKDGRGNVSSEAEMLQNRTIAFVCSYFFPQTLENRTVFLS